MIFYLLVNNINKRKIIEMYKCNTISFTVTCITFFAFRELLQACIKEVWREASAANIQDKLFFKIKQNGQVLVHSLISE